MGLPPSHGRPGPCTESRSLCHQKTHLIRFLLDEWVPELYQGAEQGLEGCVIQSMYVADSEKSRPKSRKP